MAELKGANSKRKASHVIKGFIYQFCLSLDAWMKLGENELLILEGAEDLEIQKRDSIDTIEVKHVKSKVSLNSDDIQKAIVNFWTYREKNPEKQIRFRFISTSLPRQEQSSPFGGNIKGLELWSKTNKTSEEFKSLVRFLKNLPALPDDLKTFLASANEDKLQKEFFEPLIWDLGEKPLEILRPHVEGALINLGLRYPEPIPAKDSKKTFPTLMFQVIDEIIDDQSQGLTLAGFHLAFNEAFSSFYQEVRARKTSEEKEKASIISDYGQAKKNKELADLILLQSHLTEQPPIPPHSVPRKALIQQADEIAAMQSIAFVMGSSGVGKTTLASQHLQSAGADNEWIDLRSLEPKHIRQIFHALNTHIHLKVDNKKILVLDDLDLRKGYRDYEHELKLLLFNASLHKKRIVVTCQTEPPQRLLHDTWLTKECLIKVGHFDLNEIAEIALANGCSAQMPASTWANILYLGTSGHPQLVRAKIRNLQSKDWAFDKTDVLGSEAVKNEKRDIRNQLINEIPNSARDLAYRLSLVLGTFTKNMVDSIGKLDPEIHMSGEAFDMLVGPWIEQTTKDRYRVSPLLASQGAEVFSEDKQLKIHSAIAIGYLTQKMPLTQNEVSNIFMHGIRSNDGEVLTGIAMFTLDKLFGTDSREDMKYVAEELFWFYLIAKEKGQRIYSDNLHLNYMLRLIQFRFFCLSDEGQDASILAERLLDDMKAAMQVAKEKELLDEGYLNDHNELMTYNALMVTIEKRISPFLILPFLPRLEELMEKYKEEFPSEGIQVPQALARITGKPYFDLVSTFLEAQTVCGNGTPDLEELFDCIDGLEEKPKAFILDTLKENPRFVRSLCDNPWVQEIFQKDIKDIEPLIRVYEKGIAFADQWGVSQLKLHCVLTISVLYDEYGHDMNTAFKVLRDNEVLFADFQELLLHQKAKIFFNNKKHEEAKSLWEQTLALNALDGLDKVFALRNTAISFARCDDWVKARDYMQECLTFLLHIRKQDGYNLEFFDVGLTADIAFADWKLERWKDAIKGFSRCLAELEELKKTEETKPPFIALYARISHMIAWVAGGAKEINILPEPPPCCAGNTDGRELFKDFQMRPSIFLWSCLSDAEQQKDLDVGVSPTFIKKSQEANLASTKLLSDFHQIDIAFKNFEFSNIVLLAANLLRSRRALENVKLEDVVSSDITVDKLCDFADLDQSLLRQIVFHVIFATSVVLYINEKTPNKFIGKWEKQLRELKLENYDLLNEFLSYLKQNKLQLKPFSPWKEGELDQCKFVIENIPLLLTPSEVDVVTLFSLHFYMIKVLNNQTFKKQLEAQLLDAVKMGWREVATNKTFALRSPRLDVPRIEKVCDTAIKGNFSGVATILLEVSECVDIGLPENAKEYLGKLSLS